MPSGGKTGFIDGLTEKAWSSAEKLEAKGIPLATFCDKHHINPLLLIALIAVAIIVLLALALGAAGGVSMGALLVQVESDGFPIEDATVYYNGPEGRVSNTTDANGRANIKFPRDIETTISASSEGYVTASEQKLLESEDGSVKLELAPEVGSLSVDIEVSGGGELPSGTYATLTSPGKYSQTKSVLSNKASFSDIPAGAEGILQLSIGKEKYPPAGQKVTITQGENTAKITIPKTSLTTSLQVKVVDSEYQPVLGADVQLFDWDTSTLIGGPETTYNDGTVSISGVPLGTSVYATVYPSTASVSQYNGKTAGNKLDVSKSDLIYQVSLQTVGKVEVCVYDNDGYPLDSGTLMLRGIDGVTYGTARPIDSACEDFAGLPEGVSVYPVVQIAGYAPYESPANAKTISYSGVTSFTVTMQEQSASSTVTVYAHVDDCGGDPLTGIKVMIIDAATDMVIDEDYSECMGTITGLTIPSCGNTKVKLSSGREVYAVAYDDDYLLSKSGRIASSEGAIMNIVACRADDDNSGEYEVCVYKDGDTFDNADLELYNSNNELLWTAETGDDDAEEENCYTFKNIPDGTQVYVKALNLGSSPKTSGVASIVGGSMANGTIYTGSAPVIIDNGDIKVCVTSEETGLPLRANITVYDYTTGQAIVSARAGVGGCWPFTDVPAEVNNGGQIVQRDIYVVVKAEDYATYDGESEGDIIEMIPNGEVTVDVSLPEAYPICVQARLSDSSQPAADIDVIMYYNDNFSAPIKTIETDSSGIARFYGKELDEYYFKVKEDLTLYAPLDDYEFEASEVSNGSCGEIVIYNLGSLCTLGIEVLDSGDNVRIQNGEKGKIPLRILVDGARGESSITTGVISGEQKVYLINGDEANLTLRLNGAYEQFSLGYAQTDYSPEQEVVAIVELDEDGNYSGIFQIDENAQCSRQAGYDLDVYTEALKVTIDSVTFDPTEQTSAGFCIFVSDQDGEEIKDASVTVSVDEMDGWATTATRTATYDEAKNCFRGAILRSMAPKDNGDYESGILTFTVITKWNGLSKAIDADAKITATKLCGNGEIDSGEQCDPAADPTGCSSGYGCTQECKCSKDICGSLSVSATPSSVSVDIGSGGSVSFLVKVTDDCGIVKDATVSAYPSSTSTSVSASYNSGRGGYYITMPESAFYKKKTSSNYYNTYTNQVDYDSSQSISVNAVSGDRSGSTSVSASVDCGCDDESWYEAGCICDDDTNAGGAGINLAGCIWLMNQNGYSVPNSGNSPYGTSYGSPYGSTVGGTPQMGTTIAPGGVSMGGAGFNLENCKKLLGMGDDKASGATNGDVVWVRDYTSTTTTKIKGQSEGFWSGWFGTGTTTRENDPSCKQIIDHFKANGASYVYVTKGTDTGTTYCCSDNVESFWGDSCNKDSFTKLFESSVTSGKSMIVDIRDEINDATLKTYGLSDKYKVYKDAAVYAVKGNEHGLYTPVVGIAANAVTAPGGKTASKYLLWATATDIKGNSAFNNYFNIWKKSSTGAKGSSAKVDALAYPADAKETDKTIALAENTLSSSAKSVVGTLTPYVITTQDIPKDVFKYPGDDTKIYVLTTADKYGTSSLAGTVAKNLVGGQAYPKFEDVQKDGAISYCDSVTKTMNPMNKGKYIMPNADLFVLGKVTTTCTTTSGGTVICNTPTETKISQYCTSSSCQTTKLSKDAVAYAKKGAKNQVVVVTAADCFIPTDAFKTNAQLPMVYSAENNALYYLRAKCTEKQLTCSAKTYSELEAGSLSKTNVPDGLSADNLLICACGVTATEGYTKLKVKVSTTVIPTDKGVTCSDLTIRYAQQNLGVKKVDGATPNGQNCEAVFEVKNDVDAAVRVGVIVDNICYNAEMVVPKSDLSGKTIVEKDMKLAKTDSSDCYVESASSNFKVTAKIQDKNIQAVTGATASVAGVSGNILAAATCKETTTGAYECTFKASNGQSAKFVATVPNCPDVRAETPAKYLTTETTSSLWGTTTAAKTVDMGTASFTNLMKYTAAPGQITLKSQDGKKLNCKSVGSLTLTAVPGASAICISKNVVSGWTQSGNNCINNAQIEAYLETGKQYKYLIGSQDAYKSSCTDVATFTAAQASITSLCLPTKSTSGTVTGGGTLPETSSLLTLTEGGACKDINFKYQNTKVSVCYNDECYGSCGYFTVRCNTDLIVGSDTAVYTSGISRDNVCGVNKVTFMPVSFDVPNNDDAQVRVTLS